MMLGRVDSGGAHPDAPGAQALDLLRSKLEISRKRQLMGVASDVGGC